MAIEKNIVIGADLSGLERKLDELIDALKASQKQADKTAEAVNDIADSAEDIGKSAQESKKGVKALSTGFKGLGMAMKAAGIGLVIEALKILKELFDNNQQVVDFFNTSFNTLQIAFSDFTKWISGSGGSSIVNYFKAIFEDPKQALKDFADAFKKNIQERFESYLDTLGFLASAVKKVFSGDFAGALEDVKLAGKETVDVFTGVDGAFDKIVDTTKKVATAVVDYTTKTVKAAVAMTELNKSAELADSLSQGLIEKYDLQAEKLRQVRDDERFTIQERIKANEDLGAVLRKQEDEMLKLAEIRLAKANQDLAIEKDNVEFKKAQIEATNELAAVQAQVAGFRSEQLMNEMALERELVDLEISKAENAQEVAEIQAEAAIEAELNVLKQLELEEQLNQELYNSRLATLEQQKALYAEGTQSYQDMVSEINVLNAERTAQEGEEARKRQDLERQVQDAKVQMSMDAISAINGLVQAFAGENEKAQKRAFMINKVAGIANAVISTAQGISKALAETTDPTPTQSFRFANAALVGATGAAQIATIARQQFSGGGSVDTNIPDGGGSFGSMTPQFNVVGSTGTNAILQSLQQNPVKAYVVGSDVTSQQELDRNRIKQSTF
jgi:hypothetical protein